MVYRQKTGVESVNVPVSHGAVLAALVVDQSSVFRHASTSTDPVYERPPYRIAHTVHTMDTITTSALNV